MRIQPHGIIEFDVSIGKKKKIVIKLEAKLVEEGKSISPIADKIVYRMEKVEKNSQEKFGCLERNIKSL